MQAIYDKILAAINNPNNQISVIETDDEIEIEISSCTEYCAPALHLIKDPQSPFSIHTALPSAVKTSHLKTPKGFSTSPCKKPK